MGRGVSSVYGNVVVPNCVPIERLSAASGILMIINGLLLMIVGPFVGISILFSLFNILIEITI